MHIPEIRHTGAPIHHIRDKAFELVLEMMSKYKTWGATLWGILAIRHVIRGFKYTRVCLGFV